MLRYILIFLFIIIILMMIFYKKPISPEKKPDVTVEEIRDTNNTRDVIRYKNTPELLELLLPYKEQEISDTNLSGEEDTNSCCTIF